MPQFETIQAIDADDQEQTVTLDLGPFLPAGVILVGIPVFTLSVTRGSNAQDATPTARMSGAGQVGTAPGPRGSGVPGTAVLQRFVTLVANVIYLVYFKCARSDGDVITGWAFMPCVKPGGCC